MNAQRTVLAAVAVMLLLVAGIKLRTHEATDPANEARRAALGSCAQRVEGEDATICVPQGWVAWAKGEGGAGPAITQAAVAHDGNAFQIDIRDSGGELTAKMLMVGPLDEDDEVVKRMKNLPGGADTLIENEPVGEAFDSSDDPVVRGQAVLSALVSQADGMGTGDPPAVLPDGTVPGAVVIANPPRIMTRGPGWAVVRGDQVYRIGTVWNPDRAPGDPAILTSAAQTVLASWTWN